ncbi:MAG: DNA topoisomerase IB [Mycobacteriales bacterium]
MYHDEDGARIGDPEVLARIRGLVIPPAWKDVWICADERGHLQAVGTDSAGRRQYLYHDAWRAHRDRVKYRRVQELAGLLPAARETFREHLDQHGLTETRVLATAAQLLDLGFFRVGNSEYTEEHGTYGLTTMRRDQVRVRGDKVIFDYVAKYSRHTVQSVTEPRVRAAVLALLRRRGGGDALLAYRAGPGWHEVTSEDVNAYLKDVIGEDFTAKDFRTWHGTVLYAAILAGAPPVGSRTARQRVIRQAVKEVAEYLGNTPAVCRASYLDPRVTDCYLDGRVLDGPPEDREEVEAAVLELLAES